MMIALVAAYSKNHVIGNKGCIPWKIQGEQKRFKELTTGNVVVMGRRSYEEIGHPLSDRTTIIVSSTQNFNGENYFTVPSLQEAIALANHKDIYVSGGAGLYQEAIDIVDKMFITEIDMEIVGDTYFPKFDQNIFIREVNEKFDGIIPYTYLTYTKKKK